MSTPRVAAFGDSFAIGLSGLCLVHCLALPVAASLLPVLGAWTETEWVHWLFALMAAPISAWTLMRPADRSWRVIGLAALGLALLFAGAAEFPSHEMETPVTVAGSLFLAGAHILNWRRRRPHCRLDQCA